MKIKMNKTFMLACDIEHCNGSGILNKYKVMTLSQAMNERAPKKI